MPTEAHPRRGLNHTLLSPVRLSIVAALSEVERADFKALAEVIELSDSALSKNLAMLEEVGFVDIEKGRINRRPRTWVRLTTEGSEVFHTHLKALRATVASRFPGLDDEFGTIKQRPRVSDVTKRQQ